MKYTGTISSQQDTGESVRIGIANVRGKRDAQWRSYGKAIEFDVNYSAASSFLIGRTVTIEIKPNQQ